MPSNTNEQALEAAIERRLTGTTQETLRQEGNTHFVKEAEAPYGGHGYWMGLPEDFNKTYAVDERRFWHFLQTSQPEELAKLSNQPDYKLRILQYLNKLIKKHGVLHILRNGLKMEGAQFIMHYAVPLPSSSQDVKDRYGLNEFSITRQVRYSTANPREEIDMVVCINGLPVATIELKNHWTGQTAKVHGTNQYRYERDASQPLLQFGRCLVHFAADTEEVYMATKLVGKDTVFLPFNKGNGTGAGNPVNPEGHRTAYLWEEVLQPRSLSNIIEHFVILKGKMTTTLDKRDMLFPRYHQLNVVRDLINDVERHGVGKTYLVQHSAGSGKSYSITWLAYQLIETYPLGADLPGSRGIHHPLYDSVIVVTDRRLLDKQLRDDIKAFSQLKDIVAPALSSKDLREAMEKGKRIIITTIQKFPFVVDKLADQSDKRFAVIIDEAHSSQSGQSHDKMNTAMGVRPGTVPGDSDDPDAVDPQDLIVASMQGRKMRGNASYFAFTATPKNTTLEKFGTQQPDGSFRPFHLYSMKQAIEEGFILDVLANYTTYKSYYEIAKSIEDNPEYDTQRAQKMLKAYVESHKETIKTKAEVMIEHFIPHVVSAKKLKGQGKGMVITQSIESAIRYHAAIKQILADRNAPFKALIAFSGKKTVDGIEYTEDSINGFPGKDIKEEFDTDKYRLLVVANKFLTGFDQKKLCTMYVDKRLQGVLAVQALSRLNRAANHLNKRTEDLFVLDFFNTTEEIQTAFDPFYTATSLTQATDVNVLHELKDYLDEPGVYEWQEVEQFNEMYFSGVEGEELSPIISRAADRFNMELDLADNEKADFKIKAKQFVKVYGQMASILSFEVLVWEKLFWFLKFLIPHLHVKNKAATELHELLESVDLSTYGLQRTRLNYQVTLDDADSEVDPQNPNPRGAHSGEEELDELDEIIREFNERYFSQWNASPEKQRVTLVELQKSMEANPRFKEDFLNNAVLDNKELAFDKMMDTGVKDQKRTDMEFYRLYFQDPGFRQAVRSMMRVMINKGGLDNDPPAQGRAPM
ncbi:type I restriction endonuclease subunit R [Roseivirga sp. BDSF3-8]|uniref:type I restriction endonuclease subunit R n=1 Tax=Roseivirga sp. BDSF3-8 TaxID=3241598 RepID=UPI00353193C9